MKQVMDMLLSLPANTPADWEMLIDMGINVDEIDEDLVNNLLVVNAALLKKAKTGDVNSIKELRNIIRDNVFENHKIKLDNAYLDIERKRLNRQRVTVRNTKESQLIWLHRRFRRCFLILRVKNIRNMFSRRKRFNKIVFRQSECY